MKYISIVFTSTMLLLLLSSCEGNQGHSQEQPIIVESTVMTKSEALALVKPFYDFLGGDASSDQVRPSYHEDWKSYYDNTGARSMDETVGFVSGPLAQMIPDLNWEIKELYITNEDQIIVRGEATGTPVGDSFMGSPISGNMSFKFMSIDIHELRDGKIARTYHVEDWKSAIEQVVGE